MLQHTQPLLFAMAATCLMAGSAFPVNNNDSCDIGVTPAATLLLPYFEVNTAPGARTTTTLFTITNTSRYPQIAHVTVWTDWSFPVLNFNLFLTGYDVQGINLFDLIVRGIVVPAIPSGTSLSTVPGAIGVTGARPVDNTSNPNFVATGGLNVSTTCAGLPGMLPTDLVLAVRNALTVGYGYNTGGVNCSGPVGANHAVRAIGYVTVDVVSYCSTQFPTDAGGAYFLGPAAPILFDNVLIGDYQQLGATAADDYGNTAPPLDAQGNPMVHIRATPEGGLSGASGGVSVPTNLPFTFYDRYTPAAVRTGDRRQPLPSMWAARYIQGGTAQFATDFKIWREGVTAGRPTCSNFGTVQANSAIAVTSMVRFDEHENSWGLVAPACPNECPPFTPSLPATSRVVSWVSIFPPITTTDLGGWMFLNLSSGSLHATPSGYVCDATLSAQRAGFTSGYCNTTAPGTSGSRTTTQNWVSVSMFGAVGASRLSVDFDAAWLGNGCTPAEQAGATIAPSTQRTGVLVCPSNTASSNCASATRPPPVNP